MAIRFLGLGFVMLLVCSLGGVERSEAATPSCYGGTSASVEFTQYWIPHEGQNDEDDNGNVISLTGTKNKRIQTDSGSLIETTDTNTYNKCVEEGTCLLLNGDLVNLASTATTFQVLDKSRFPYGQGSSGKALVPFVSVAANDLSQGTTLVVSQLQNFKLPNGKTHNGCVRVDDTGVNFSCHLDWFVNTYADNSKLNNLPEKVTAKATSCTVLTYV